MIPAQLDDNIRRGLGRAATVLGPACDAYRPYGPNEPLAPRNRYLRLPAAFSPPLGFHRAQRFGESTWTGIFDAAYTAPGDYLVRPDGAVWFIAAQPALMPILCVRADRTVTIARAAAPRSPGLNGYGGLRSDVVTPVALSWPASILATGGNGIDASLPADAAPGAWAVLLPNIPGAKVRTGDLLTDDLGRNAVIAAVERTELGLRLLAKQATT